jgi:hypothetical protein
MGSRSFPLYSLIFIFFLAFLEFAVLSQGVPVCSDTANYLSHSGSESLSFAPDALLYYLLYLVGDNQLWFQLIQALSVFVFAAAVAALGMKPTLASLLSISPFIFSIVGFHLWACAIRAGISFSFIILTLSLIELSSSSSRSGTSSKVSPYSQKILLLVQIISAFISVLLHWSSAFILIASVFLASSQFEQAIALLMARKVKIRHLLFVLVAFILLFLMFFVFSSRLDLYIPYSSGADYGTKLPFIVLAILCLAVPFFNPFSTAQAGLSRPRGIYILFFAGALSLLSMTGFNENIVRLLAPLQLISIFYIIIDTRHIMTTLVFLAVIAPPFIFYSINTYISSFIS